MKYLCSNWQELHNLTHTLSEKIEKSKNKYDLIVAVARGGLTISHMLSDFLHLPITTFTVSSYKDFKQTKMSKITLKIGNKLHNKKILLIDDVSDTGKTFIRGIKYLKELGAEEIITASVFIKPWTKFTPDYYVESTDKWIIFPYDLKETITDLKKNTSAKDLLTIGIPKYFIEKYGR